MSSPVEDSLVEGSPRLAERYERKMRERLQSEADALEQKRIQDHENRLQEIHIPGLALSREIDASEESAPKVPLKPAPKPEGLTISTGSNQEPDDIQVVPSSSEPTDSVEASPEATITSVASSLQNTPLPNDPVIEVLQHELGKVKDEVEQLKQARDERNDQIRHLQEQLNEAQEKYHLSIGTVKEEVTTLSETVDHLRRELEKTRRERDGYAKEVRELQDKEARLNDELHNERIIRQKFIQEGAEKDLNAEQERNRLLGIIEELSRQKTIPKERRPAGKVIQQQREPQRAWLELDPLDLSSMYLVPLEEEAGESAQKFQPKKLERKFRKTQMYTGSRANMTVRKWRRSHDTFNLPGGTFVLG